MSIVLLLIILALICFGLGFVIKWLFFVAAVLLVLGLLRAGMSRGSRSRL